MKHHFYSLFILVVLTSQACTGKPDTKILSESKFPITFANIQAFQINEHLVVDSTHVGTEFYIDQDTIVHGIPMTECICSKTESGINISIRYYHGFESQYMDIDYYKGTYDLEINYVSDLPDPETSLFQQSLTLSKFSFVEGDTLNAQVELTGVTLSKDPTMDSLQFVVNGLFQCVVKHSPYNWSIWNDEMIAEYNIDRVIQFRELAYSDSASKVTSLDLNNLGLTAIPDEIVRFKNLEELWMIGNNVSHFDIKLLGQLKNLRLINLDNSEIQRLPENIARLSKLEILSLGSNPIISIPKSIYRLSNLKELDLSLTKISRIDPEISELTQLQKLDLGSNHHLYDIPDDVFELRSLKELSLPIIFDSYGSQSWALDSLKSLSINYLILKSRPDIVEKLKGLTFLYPYHEFKEGKKRQVSSTYRTELSLEARLPETIISNSTHRYKRKATPKMAKH